jgi:penicillin amidase
MNLSCGGIISVPKLKRNTVEIITKSFKEAIISLENQLGESVESWTWDKVHVVQHPIGKIAADNYLM